MPPIAPRPPGEPELAPDTEPEPAAAALQHRPDALADLAQRGRFVEALAQSLADGRFRRLVLSKPLPAACDLVRVTARPLVLRGQACVSMLYHHATRDVTRNEPPEEAGRTLATLLDTAFAQANLDTDTLAWQLMRSRKGRYSLHRGRAEAAAGPAGPAGALPGATAEPPSHDRRKHRYLSLDTPFLAALGVTDARGQLVPAMARKWKQINKFVEIMAHALERAGFGPQAPLSVVDFGAGKGYLTFALHDFLRGQAAGAPRALDVRGVELREELVRQANEAVAACGLQGLRFEHGDIAQFLPRHLDVMIALHACDTATDLALHAGIRAGAAILMCSPCCHKQIRPQMSLPPVLAPMLHHGIHLGQQAEMVTDSLRALLLEAEGYDAQVFEFVALEHTSKNKMILAVRRPEAPDSPAARRRRGEALAQVEAIKAFYGVGEQCLQQLLLRGA